MVEIERSRKDADGLRRSGARRTGLALGLSASLLLLTGCELLEDVESQGSEVEDTNRTDPEIRDGTAYQPAPNDAPPQSFFDPSLLADVAPKTEPMVVIDTDPDLPPIGEWRPIDAIAARIGERTILWSEIRDQARALAQGKEVTAQDLRLVLIREAIDEAWAQLGKIQGGPELRAMISRYQSDRRQREIERNGGFQNLERQTTAVGSTLREGDEETERQIWTSIAQRELINPRIGGDLRDNAHVLVTPAEMRREYDKRYGSSTSASTPVEIEVIKAESTSADAGSAQAFADAWATDVDTELPEGFERRRTQRVAPDDSSAIEFLATFAESSKPGGTLVQPTRSGFLILRNAGSNTPDAPSFDDPQTQRALRATLAQKHTQGIRMRALGYGILQIPIWPQEVRSMVLQELFAR